MNLNRAEEIINSEKTIDVFYNNHSVWIDNLNFTNQTAEVTVNNGEHLEIPLTELKEAEN
ncbi:MAG: H-type small acid-soluble spore protein [Vulcanibacillus sp.]